MNKAFSMRRLGGILAGTVAGTALGLIAAAGPAPALGVTVGTTGSLVHLQDCRSVALSRHVAYDVSFSSQTTGAQPVHVAVQADGSLTLCYSLDVPSVSSVQVTTWTDVTADSLVASLLGEADASHVCTAIDLKTASGVTGTVTATAHAYASVDGLPPVTWDDQFAKDTSVSNLGDNVVLKACFDTNGGASAA